MTIAFLTGISTEHQYLGPMRPDGVILDPPDKQYQLVFNYGQFRLPITPEQAQAIDEFMTALQEEGDDNVKESHDPHNGAVVTAREEPREPAGAQVFSMMGSDDYSSPPHEVTETDDEEEDGIGQF